ncbi:MAG: hypothetical protein PUE71_03365 [Clostridia bacterium]|nr:hypothetical protein [Clostridia bacterium]
MKKFLPYIRCMAFLIVLAGFIALNNFLFAPSGYIRFILHELNSREQNYDCIILGASHARSAIDPAKIDEKLGTNALNLAIPGETIKDSYYLLKESCEKNDVKTVILDVDYQYWYSVQIESEFGTPFIFNKMSWLSKTKYEYIIDNMDKLDFRNTFTDRLSYSMTGEDVAQNVSLKLTDDYRKYSIRGAITSDANGPYVGKGFFYRETSGLPPGGFEYLQHWYGRENGELEGWVINYFSQIVNYCNSNNIELICVTSPITPTAVRKLGLDKVDKTFNEFFAKYNVPYYNFNLLSMSILPRDDVDFGDMEGHMGGELAEKYSEVLATLLNDRKDGSLDTDKYFYDSFSELYKHTYRDRRNKTRE